MNHSIGIIVNIFLSTFPGTFLQYYLNFDWLKTKKSAFICIYVFIYAIQAIGFLLIQHYMTVDFRVIQLYKTVFSVECLVMSFALVNEHRYRLLFTYFINAVCMTTIMRIANHIDLSYAGGGIRALRFDLNNLIMLFVLAVFMPFIVQFYRRVLKPALPIIDPDIFRIIWVIPALFFAISILTSSVFSFDNMTNQAFLPTTLLIFGGILASCFVLLKTLSQSAENAALKENARMTEQLLTLQSEQYDMMTKNTAHTKAARHDLRHQLAVLQSLGGAGELQKLNAYLDELIGGIKHDEDDCLLCSNYAVNAVARHYLSIAKREGVEVDVRLDIPEKAGQVPDRDLCIVMGNLLENAVEACRRMKAGQRFIRIRAKTENGYLTITVDNSFDGVWQAQGGAYLSRKHEGEGIGLSSVRAVAEKYDGLAEFRVSGQTFLASALVAIENNDGTKAAVGERATASGSPWTQI